jgi:cytochrome oxidase Cu insertion factor (SCO1/SenC/PrrC family)
MDGRYTGRSSGRADWVPQVRTPAGLASLRRRAALLAVLFGLSAHAATVGSARLDQLPQSWVDDQGASVQLRDFAGHRVILTMAFAGCHQLCPAAITELKLMQKALDLRNEQAEILVVGLDPQNENPALWHQYRKTHQLARPNWHFLTGTAADTERLARQLGFDFWKLDDHVMHDSRALIFDDHGLLAKELGSETKTWRHAL